MKKSATSRSWRGSGIHHTGFKFGLIGSGSVGFGDRGIKQRVGPSAGFFFDQPFGPRLHYGLSMDLHKMSWRRQMPANRWDQSEWLLDLGVNLKGNLLSENSPLDLRPGVGAGVAFLGRMESAGVSGSNYLTLRAFVELIFVSASDLMGMLEGGVWYAPSGGDNASDLSIGPLWTLRFGVMF